jgi:cytochrome o ubiquinol oxidase operon protein cyoD
MATKPPLHPVPEPAKKPIVVSWHHAGHATTGTYTLGYIVSIALTLIAYLLVVQHALPRAEILTCISVFAVLQFVAQLYFFLHLGEEVKPRYRLYMLLFMIVIVLIIVLGSVWIMNNLNYNMQMSPDQLKTYMHSNEGL